MNPFVKPAIGIIGIGGIVAVAMSLNFVGDMPAPQPVGMPDGNVKDAIYFNLFMSPYGRFFRQENKHGSFHRLSGTIAHLPGVLDRLAEFSFWLSLKTMHEQQFGENSLAVASDKEHLGDILMRQGDYLNAFAKYNSCYKIRSSRLKAGDPLIQRVAKMNRISWEKADISRHFKFFGIPESGTPLSPEEREAWKDLLKDLFRLPEEEYQPYETPPSPLTIS